MLKTTLTIVLQALEAVAALLVSGGSKHAGSHDLIVMKVDMFFVSLGLRSVFNPVMFAAINFSSHDNEAWASHGTDSICWGGSVDPEDTRVNELHHHPCFWLHGVPYTSGLLHYGANEPFKFLYMLIWWIDVAWMLLIVRRSSNPLSACFLLCETTVL